MSKQHWWVGGLLFGPAVALAACLDDADCAAGSRCLTARGYENRCASYMPPVAITKEAGRLRTPLEQRDSGYPCQFTVDCAPGYACYKKQESAVEGQCLPSR